MRSPLALVCLAGLLVCLPSLSVAEAPQRLPGRLVPLIADPNPSTFRVPRFVPEPRGPFAPKAVSAAINVNFLSAGAHYGETCGTWSASAQAAFAYAANIWSGQIQSAVPITVDACWATSLPANVLGSAGAFGIVRNATGLPQTDTWYGDALANALTGADAQPGQPEIVAIFNSNFPNWYFGTDGNPGTSNYDFVSVVLHEIGHGLGFFGLVGYDMATGEGSWGFGGFPAIYDRYAENGSGQSLLNTTLFPNPSTALGAELTSNNLFFDGPFARASHGANRPPLYAPATFAGGSSYSHLAESFNGTASALMTYSIAQGEVLHDPGPVGRGVLQDLGWRLGPNGVHLLSVVKTGTGAGTVTSNVAGIQCGATCQAEVNRGSTVTLTATASGGSLFVGWSGGGCSGTGTCTVTLSTPQTVTATFNASGSTFPITTIVSPASSGSVTCSPNPVPSGGSSACSATATDGYVFAGFSGSCVGAACTLVNVTGSRSVTGTFARSGAWLVNGDFEAGNVEWLQQSLYPIIVTSAGEPRVARSGSQLAWLGGYNNAEDILQQVVTLPSSAITPDASLSFWYKIATSETLPAIYDSLKVYVLDSNGSLLQTLATLSNLNATSTWTRSPTFNLAAYRGQTIRLTFVATTDSVESTSFYLDDIVLGGTSLTVSSLTATGNPALTSRGTLTAGPGVTFSATSDADLIAGNQVRFIPVFRVLSGGRLRVFVDPALAP